MTWFLLALCAALFWAVGQVLVKKGFDHIPPLWSNIFTNTLVCVIHIVPVLFLSGFRITVPPLPILVTIVITASFYHTFYYAISKGEISLTGTLVAGYPMITVLLSGLFLGERLEPVQYLGVGLVVTGVVLVALPENRMSEKLKDFSWIVWGLACAFLIGAGDFLTKLSINRIGAYSHILFLAVVSNPMGGLNYLIDRKGRPFPDIKSKKALPTLIGLVAMSIGTLLFILSFDYGKVSLIAPVSSIYPAIIAVLAVRFLGETITAKQGTGIGIIVAGLVLIGLGTI
jgi:transporter family protein